MADGFQRQLVRQHMQVGISREVNQQLIVNNRLAPASDIFPTRLLCAATGITTQNRAGKPSAAAVPRYCNFISLILLIDSIFL